MKKIPEVAIITRTKDREVFLDRAIKDVMAQTFQNFIMVIVNDGGDPAIIEKLLNKNQEIIKGRVKVITNKDSLGMQAASNIGIENSSSKYLVIHDDDDTWGHNFLKETVGVLERTTYKGVVTASTIINEEVKGKKIKRISSGRFESQINQINYLALMANNQFPNIAFLFSRDVLKKTGLFSNEATVLGDWDFNLRFLRYFDIAFIPRPLANYHHRQGQSGVLGNTAFDAENSHATSLNYLLNKYLREDLDKGDLGVGYIINSSHYVTSLHLDINQQHSLLNERIEHLQNANNRIEQQLKVTEQRLSSIEEFNNSLLPRVKNYITQAPSRLGRRAMQTILIRSGKSSQGRR